MKKLSVLGFLILIFVTASMKVKGQQTNFDSIQQSLYNLPADTSTVNRLLVEAKNHAWTNIHLAEIYTEKAISLSEKINYTSGLANSKYQMALLFKDNDFRIAESLTMEALENALKINDSILIGKIFNTIGNLKSNVNENKNAELYYNKAITVFKNIGADSLLAKVYNNLGIIYDNKQAYDTALHFYKLSAKIHLQKKNYIGLAINYLNQGYCYLLDRKYLSSKEFLDKSYSLAKAYNYERLLPYIYNNYCQYYLDQKNYPLAIQYGKKGLAQSRKQNNLLQEKNVLSLLKQSYFESNELQKAYECTEEILIVNDSISRYNKLKEIDRLEMRHKYDQERTQQLFKHELLLAEIRQKELSITLISVIAGLFIVILIFTYILQRNRIKSKNLEQKAIVLQNEKLEQQLSFKNKELTTNVMYLLKKNEFITSIANKLKNNSTEGKSNSERNIKSMVLEIERSLKENSWADFEVRFQKVHVDFYNNLSNRYPELTANDLRLCAFLRLNMTSKEIAGITYQSVDSLKTARYRLRKKLGLSREDNLVAFLTRI